MTQANRGLQKTATKQETNKQKTYYLLHYNNGTKLTAHSDIKHVTLLSATISSCENSS